MNRVRTAVGGLGLLAACSAACSGGGPSGILPPAPADEGGPVPVYVAVGASETAGIGAEMPLRDAWPRVLHREAMPVGTALVNMGIPGATVGDVLRQTADRSVELRPDVVTVWLNVNDILAGVTPAEFERDLGTLLSRLRRGGRTRVLVANAPPLDRLPSYLACRPDPPLGAAPCRVEGGLPEPAVVNGLVAAYNEATARVAEATGSLVVDLHAVGLASRAAGIDGALVSADGFHPNSGGYAVVAQAFAEVLRASGPVLAAGG